MKMAKKDMRRYSAAQLKRMSAARSVAATKADAPELHLDDDFWANASVVMPGDNRKERITMRLDREVVEFFRKQGKGYQTRMNAVLRSYVEAQRNEP